MTATLTFADILFMFDQVNAGDTPAPGADPLAPIGIRTIDGTHNNITGLTLVDQFGNIVDSSTFGNVNQTFVNWSNSVSPLAIYPAAAPGSMHTTDGSERLVSNLIADATSANPAATTAPMLTQGDVAVDRLPENSLFTFFGQFFDHGLDFINKKDSGVVLVPVAPGDPMYNPGFPFIPVTRAELDATTGDSINSTAPFVEQSQTYGSDASTTFYLMEYDVNGEPTGDLVHGADGGMGTWADIKANALKWAVAQAIAQGGPIPTEMLTDAHVLNIPDPADWNALTGTFNNPGTNGTGQAFIADIAHNANPDGGLLPDADTVINPHGFGAPPPAAGEYDNELLDAHYVSGDPRVNENTALTSIHSAFHGEHSRILGQIEDWIQQQNQIDPTFAAQWTGEMKFQAVKLANEMQYQHLVFEEFGRRMSPNIDAFASYDININPNITREFSQAVYRLGHSQLTDNVKTMNVTGDEVDVTLVDAFLDPEMFDQFGSGDFLKGGQFEQGARIDEFVVDALRNFLVGLPLDLAAINITRGRELGLPSLNQLRADLFAQTGGEASLKAYDNWAEFGANLLNPESLVNFIAAYGTHGTLVTARANALAIGDAASMTALRAAAQALLTNDAFMNEAAATSGVDNIDLWMGGLAEKKVPLGLLGSTFDFIFAQQMIALQDGDRFYYLGRIGGNLLSEIEGQTLSDIMMRSGDAIHLHGDVFGTPDALVEMGAIAAIDFLKSPSEMTAYVSEIIAGTHADNVIQAGAGNDQVFGEGGNDTLYGGENDDHVYGGSGDDVIWGDVGFDKLRGDDGNDEIHGGADDDIINGNAGDDLIFGDAGFDEIFAGTGNDTVHGGSQDDAIEGQEGDDVLHGDAGADSLLGEEGNDVLFGGLGADALAGGEGDDMLFGGAGADALDGGVGGYDIANYEDWLAGAVSGIGLTINALNSALSTGDAMLDTYLDIEEIRGTIWNDIIVGDGIVGVLNGNAGNDRITGSALDDTLIGGTGNDRLLGGLGIDTALYRGSIANFTIGTGLPGQILVTDLVGSEGQDTLTGIEWLLFDDGLVNTASFEYAPLVNISGTHERIQNGTTVIGELERNVNFIDGTAVPGVGTVVGNIEIADLDGPNGPLTLALAGPDAAVFDIVNTGGTNQLIFIGGGAASFVNYDAKPVYHVTVTAADATGGSEVNLTINVDDRNDNAPVVTSAKRVNVSEGTSPVSIVYLANSNDIDSTADNITYLLGGADAAAFKLTASGELRFADVPDTAAPADVGGDNIYNVTITAFDGLNTSAGHDVAIHVGAGHFNLLSGATPGPDSLVGTVGNDRIMALAGNDTVNGQSGDDWIQGMAGNDKLYGSSKNDILQGGDDNDYINGGLGADFIDGGAGTDMASWKFSSEGVTVNLATGVVSGGTATGDIIARIEDVEGSLNFADTITGDDGNNRIYARGGDDIVNGGLGVDRLYGEGGNDTLNGGGDNDVLLGGIGADMLNGGDGLEDWAAYYQSTAGVTVDLNLVGPQVSAGEASGDTLVNIENLQGSNLADILIGDGAANRIYGGGGGDLIVGGAGADKLYGHAGADTINGGTENDFYVGGADADTFQFDAAGFGNDVIGDYADGTDVIDVTGSGWSAALLTVTQVGANVLVSNVGSSDSIRLDGHLAANIDATDFTGLL